MLSSQSSSSQAKPSTDEVLVNMASALRVLSVDAIQKANSGHPGMPLGMADVVAVLYHKFLNYNPQDPTWINRDRLVFSAGHGSMLLYSTLHLAGYQDFTLEELKNFRQLGSKTAGHPEIEPQAGVECTTGPLGHGLGMAVGMAIASKKSAAMFGSDLINHKVYVLAGDGCLMEGVSYEAIALAGNLNLDNLIIIWDNNNITIDGTVDITSVENQRMRFEANGFTYLEADGHDYTSIENALAEAQKVKAPVIIAAKTVIGWGAPNKKNSSSVHGSPLGEEEIKLLKKGLGWPSPEPFVVPAEYKKGWEQAAARALGNYTAWEESYKGSPLKEELDSFFACRTAEVELEAGLKTMEPLNSLAEEYLRNHTNLASRSSSQQVLSALSEALPGLIGGSADLAASVMSKPKNAKPIRAGDFSGNYLDFGIREHAMGAIVNGIAAYGGFNPYGGTFLVFSDFLRPAIRLAALQKLNSIFVFSHDSIGVGEDGPTHQPVEHLLSLNIIPGLDVVRPCDAIETIEAWELALTNASRPTALILSRQNLPLLRTSYPHDELMVRKGAYAIAAYDDTGKAVAIDLHKPESLPKSSLHLIASGSEVSLAKSVAQELSKQGISTKVISVPCYRRLVEADPGYCRSLLGGAKLTVIIEAATIGDWSDLLPSQPVLKFGINTFGYSGPAQDVYAKFGLTVPNLTEQILEAYKQI